MVPERADTWTRMSYAGPNKPLAPIDVPYQMFEKLYGRMKDRESLKSVLDDLQEDMQKLRGELSSEDRRLLDEHAEWVRAMEKELASGEERNVGHAVPELEPGIEEKNDTMPRYSRMQIELLVGSFAANEAVARGLRDPDPAVRELAGHALWAIWFRAGTPEQNARLQQVRDLIARQRYQEAHDLATRLIEQAPDFAEVYNQRAIAAFFLETGPGQKQNVRDALAEPLLERAIGVIYRPETELLSHYFQAELSRQFDAWIWFAETKAVAARPDAHPHGPDETYPFGL